MKMNRQATLMRNLETGRIEMYKGNQPHTHDEDSSDNSNDGEQEDGRYHFTYMTTNILSPK